MEVIIRPDGSVHCVYDEAIDLWALGQVFIHRASRVEPDGDGGWWADLLPVRGPDLGPFPRRSDALAAEHQWLDAHLLSGCL